MPVLAVLDDQQDRRPPSSPLATEVIAGVPRLLRVYDARGLLATLTEGAKTVTVRGQTRAFTENKRPFRDLFDRTTTAGWGVSPGGGTWSNSNGVDTDYTTTPGRGLMAITAVNASRHTSLVDNTTDCDARLSWSLDRMPTGNASSLALAFAYTSSTSQYRARLSVLTSGAVQLMLECQTPSATTTLGAAVELTTGYAVGDVWHIRAQRVGTTIRCRAWKDGTPEPATWTHEVVDATLGAGRIGVRGIASSGSTAVPFAFRVHDIQLYSGAWPDPPVITHDTWVRVLSSPFTGQWSPTLAAQIQAWAVDTTPDALAYAVMYATGAPPVYDARLGPGVQVAGQSMYGPSGPDGLRIEGADFHDYVGVPWVFPNGETQAAKPEEHTCMDCSGYVRMIYGYHMGLPMVRTRSADFDGINLPRQTKAIGPSGPGVIVAQAVDTAPPIDSMLPGDIPHFDADQTDPVPGQLDHNGIFLGWDQHGRPRFINSRKTPNAATFGDLGGSSALDGTGLYATSLRLIRRF